MARLQCNVDTAVKRLVAAVVAMLAVSVMLLPPRANAADAPAPGTCTSVSNLTRNTVTKICTSTDGNVTVSQLSLVVGTDGTITVIDTTPPCTYSCTKILNFRGSCDDPTLTQAQCTGAPVNCPPGQEEFTYQEVIPNDVILYNRRYCGQAGTPNVITQLLAKFHPEPATGSLHPTSPNPLPVNLPLFVQADIPPQPGGSIGNLVDGGTITFKDPTFTWDFGDKSATNNVQTTTDPGGTYPAGKVTHIYEHAKKYTVTLTVKWHVYYTQTIGGVVGPAIDAGMIPQPGPPQTFTANVVEAHAVLVQ